MRLWFKGSSFSSTGAAGPGSEGASRAPADRHADAVHLLLALTSGEAREAGELAVHHQAFRWRNLPRREEPPGRRRRLGRRARRRTAKEDRS